MSTDKQAPRILARTFFTQLRASGYTPTQIIGIATELLDLVTEDIKGADKSVVPPTSDSQADFRREA